MSSYYFNDKKSGLLLKNDIVVGLKNQSRAREHALCDKFTGQMVPLVSGLFALSIRDCLFHIPGVSLATFQGDLTVVVMSFKVNNIPKSKKVLLGTKCLERAIVLAKHKLQILGGTEIISLDYEVNEFNYLFVCYDQNGGGLIQLNERIVPFQTKEYKGPMLSSTYLFGRPGLRSTYFDGELATLDIFNKNNTGRETFPPLLREALLRNHINRVL